MFQDIFTAPLIVLARYYATLDGGQSFLPTEIKCATNVDLDGVVPLSFMRYPPFCSVTVG